MGARASRLVSRANQIEAPYRHARGQHNKRRALIKMGLAHFISPSSRVADTSQEAGHDNRVWASFAPLLAPFATRRGSLQLSQCRLRTGGPISLISSCSPFARPLSRQPGSGALGPMRRRRPQARLITRFSPRLLEPAPNKVVVVVAQWQLLRHLKFSSSRPISLIDHLHSKYQPTIAEL